MFFHIRPISSPTVDPDDRFTVSRCFPIHTVHPIVRDCFRVTLRHGYVDEVVTPDLGMLIYEEIRKLIIREDAPAQTEVSQDESSNEESSTGTATSLVEAINTMQTEVRQRRAGSETVQERLERVKAAYMDQVTYIVGKEQMRIREAQHSRDWPRRIALAAFLWLRSNTGSKVANLNVDVDKLVELGFVKVV